MLDIFIGLIWCQNFSQGKRSCLIHVTCSYASVTHTKRSSEKYICSDVCLYKKTLWHLRSTVTTKFFTVLNSHMRIVQVQRIIWFKLSVIRHPARQFGVMDICPLQAPRFCAPSIPLRGEMFLNLSRKDYAVNFMLSLIGDQKRACSTTARVRTALTWWIFLVSSAR